MVASRWWVAVVSRAGSWRWGMRKNGQSISWAGSGWWGKEGLFQDQDMM